MMPATRDIVHDALSYAGGWGWHVFPVQPGGKRPGLPKCPDSDGLSGDRLAEHARTCPGEGHGFHDGTTDPDTVLGWWDAVPTYNVGIATGAVSGLVVLDVDPPDGTEALLALVAVHGPLPRTVAALTPRGGVHGYFAHPGFRVPCSTAKIGTNLDVRADGGYVVASPSTVGGKLYRWRDEPWPGPPDLPQLPPAWLALLAGGKDRARDVSTVSAPAAPRVDGVSGRLAAYVTAAVRGELEALATAPEGTRNHRLNQAALRLGRLAAAGALDPAAARHALTAAAAAAGLDARETDRTIRSGFGAGLEQPADLPEVAV